MCVCCWLSLSLQAAEKGGVVAIVVVVVVVLCVCVCVCVGACKRFMQ